MTSEFKNLIIELNRQGLSLFPLYKLNAISIYTSDYYENYDYDIVLPTQREKLVKLLNKHGFKQTSGRVICNQDKSIVFEFPKPNFTLGDDPASQAEKLINKSNANVVITPTQALLIYLKHFYDEIQTELNQSIESPITEELIDLLYEQPANLDKVREWLGPTNQTEIFVLLKQKFRDSQRSGIKDRLEYRFKSRIINRLTSR